MLEYNKGVRQCNIQCTKVSLLIERPPSSQALVDSSSDLFRRPVKYTAEDQALCNWRELAERSDDSTKG